MYTTFFGLVVWRHKRVPKFTWRGFHIFCNGTEFRSSCSKSLLLRCLNFLRISHRQSWPSILVRERTIVLLLYEPRVRSQMLLQMRGHGWNYVSLLSNIVPLLSIGSTLPPWALFPFWLLNIDLLTTISLRTLKFRLINIKFYRCLQSWKTHLSIVSNSFLVVQSQYSLNPSRTISVGVSPTDDKAWSHRTSKSWTSSFCKRILNKSDRPCTPS